MYLLVVGDPAEIPFEFQYGLAVQYYVGRIHFEKVDEYRRYANAIVTVERQRAQKPPTVSFFSPKHPFDSSTQLTAERLVQPMREMVSKRYPMLSVRTAENEAATKDKLLSLLGNSEQSQLLFVAAHGMQYPCGDENQEKNQGAIVCMDWPGRGRLLDPSHFLSSSDLHDIDLKGMIVFLYVSLGAAVPDADEFDLGRQESSARPQIAPRPFVAPLAKHLLGRCGAGAVIGLVGPGWGYSIVWEASILQIETFEKALTSIIDGQPVGKAHHYFVRRHAELASHFRAAIAKIDSRKAVSLHLAVLDSRNYVVIGDPAVRISAAGSGG
jgi:hypothetical protein